MFGIGQPELIIIVFILLLFFGPKSLPKVSRTMGDSLRSLREGFTDGKNDKTFKDITQELSSSARDIKNGINEVKNTVSLGTNPTNAAPVAADAGANAQANAAAADNQPPTSDNA